MAYPWFLHSMLALGPTRSGSCRRLHIGGTIRQEGWEVLNALPGPAVDHVGNAKDLSAFDTDSLEAIYASHVLEHFDYAGEIESVLREWWRALRPGGQLFVSVPDLETLARLFLDRQNLDQDERFLVTRMIFGGHTDAYDYHNAGLSEDILRKFLEASGFDSISRVNDFHLFDDTSALELQGVPISLNLVAFKPLAGSDGVASTDEPASRVAEGDSSQVSPSDSEPRTVPGSSWDHGYFSGVGYTTCFYRELAPNWLDFAALIQGQRSPRLRPGSDFRYLELGSGTGFGLCILAASYPEGSFVGVDFHPSHIAESQWLVNELGLKNIRFLEADFLELLQDSTPLSDPSGGAASFDYVVAHGIATWVSEEVQHAMLAVASAALRSGGLFYCSYNTYPGWLGRSIFKMLVGLERGLHQPSSPLNAVKSAREKLRALAGVSQPLRRQLPQLVAELKGIEAQVNSSYILGEYGTDHWKPLYVADMHSRVQAHKLSYLGSASLPEQFVSLLGEPRASQLVAEQHPTMREALFDLSINQSFRRDIFVKGRFQLSKAQRNQALSDVVLILTAQSSDFDYQVATSFDVLQLDPAICQFLDAVLSEAPRSIGELSMAVGSDIKEMLPIFSLLIYRDRIGLHHGGSLEVTFDATHAVNRRLRDLMQSGQNYGFLAAPAIGGGVSFSPLQSLVLETIQQGLDDDTAAGLVLMGLEAIGGHLTDSAGQSIQDPLQQVESLKAFFDEFRANHLPLLIRLGAVPSGL